MLCFTNMFSECCPNCDEFQIIVGGQRIFQNISAQIQSVPSKVLFTAKHLTVFGSSPNCSFKASRRKKKGKKRKRGEEKNQRRILFLFSFPRVIFFSPSHLFPLFLFRILCFFFFLFVFLTFLFLSARRVERKTPKSMVRCLAVKLLSKKCFARI